MIAFPFACTDWSSFHEIKGLLRLEDEDLVLEYRIVQWGCLPKARVREARLPREVITAMTLRKGWFRDVLAIQTSSLRSWEEFPGAVDGRARLIVGKEDRETARELVALLSPEKAVSPIDEFA
ncbi:hypothetical protein [Tautonia sociabilis]|uniref:Uncharacterized protein n=1 Tax=Tautonia sociabilis TaxID=2080755 RepID=A0A432MLE6_9BACT|nr:hypothetical protein [Tautonia sociabilis]RUL88244.1 hypothetical protein TsocGM_07860 [Tautonia sociabilis]